MGPSVERPRARKRSVAFWLGIALLVHGELALVLGVGFYVFAPRDADLQRKLAEQGPGESIDVGMVDEDAAREIIADLERAQEKHEAEKVQKEIDSVKAPGQVIDLPAPAVERRPDDARFAGEHDSTVEHETHKLGKFDEKSRAGRARGVRRSPARHARRAARRTPRDARARPRARAARRGAARAARAGAADRLARTASPSRVAPEADGSLAPLGVDQKPRATGGGLPAGGSPALVPTAEQLAHVIGGSTPDYLRDVDEGEETALNSKKWRFATFFNRVKKQVSEHWHPEEAYRRRDPTGVIYGHQNRYTELHIQLKADGHLANIGVNLPSGLEFLDDEAITAFKEAQPFPNPPRQLLERDGFINFSFGFLFDLNGPPQMRWFKYND